MIFQGLFVCLPEGTECITTLKIWMNRTGQCWTPGKRMEGPLASLWSKPMDPVVAAVGHDLGYLFEAVGSF